MRVLYHKKQKTALNIVEGRFFNFYLGIKAINPAILACFIALATLR